MRSGYGVTVAAVILLAGCQAVPMGFPSGNMAGVKEPVAPQVAPSPLPATLPPAKGEVLGTGSVRVAMLLPLTAPGNAGAVASAFRNAARLALEDFGGTIQLVIKDTAGVATTATDAAGEAFNEGAAIVLGPLFSGNVSAVGGVLVPRSRLMIAFSSDATVARRGVYLNSFLPGPIIDKTLRHASGQGVRRVTAILPQGAFGILVETEARKALAAGGGQLVGVVRYAYDDASVAKAVADAIPLIAQSDAVLLPDGGNTPAVFARQLRAAGAELAGKRFLGSGQWAKADLSDQAFNGAWYADTDQSRIGQFQQRYRQKFGAEAATTAALAYDTVALVAGITRNGGASALRQDILEASGGYNGYAGIFRFLPNGLNERGYSVYEVNNGQKNLVSPAPTSFRPGM